MVTTDFKIISAIIIVTLDRPNKNANVIITTSKAKISKNILNNK
jgi:hypothetical protein